MTALPAGSGIESVAGVRRTWHLPLPDAAPGEPEVFLIDYDEARFNGAAFAAMGIACPDEIARSVRKRQAEYFFGRLAARQALARFDCGHVQIASGRHREPVWPPGFIGSITHAGGIAAAIALRRGMRSAVGIDVEAVVGADLRPTLRLSVLDAAEFAYVEALAGRTLSFDQLLTLAFSAKESLFKAGFASVGDYFGFEAVRVLALDLAGQRVALEVQRDLGTGLRRHAVRWLHYALLRPDLVFTSCLW